MGTGAGCNAGGAGCAALSGSSKFYGYGGSTDIRLGTDSLYARVIVAGGGDGTDNSGDGEANNDGSGGYGGGISGGDATGSAKLKGATQTSGYQFGVGQNCGTGIDLDGGGGEWWGELSEQSTNTNSGGYGGSGFIYTSETPAAPLDSATIGGKFLLTNTQQLSTPPCSTAMPPWFSPTAPTPSDVPVTVTPESPSSWNEIFWWGDSSPHPPEMPEGQMA